MAKQKVGGNSRKYGRNRAWCERYRARGQRERNKQVRLKKHLLRFPGDGCALAALNRVSGAHQKAA